MIAVMSKNVIRGSVGVETTIVLPFTNKRDNMQDICVKAANAIRHVKSDPKSGPALPKLTLVVQTHLPRPSMSNHHSSK